MKQILLSLFSLSSLLALAQPPAGYYDSAQGLTGFALKTELKSITSNGAVVKTYGDLLTLYVTSDNDEFYDTNQENTVLDIYSENPTGADPYNYSFSQGGASATAEGQGTNREHLYPQGFFNSNDNEDTMRNDAHHVVPSDIFVNSARNNFPFGVVGNTTFVSQNGSKLGNSITPGYNLTVFEPIDEFKGDVARSLLYFATRYEDKWNDPQWKDLNDERDARGGPNKGQWYDTWFINLLLQWHAQDPVSARELDRNNEVYIHQNNRNPFIDNPQYVSSIWGNIADIAAITGTLSGTYVDANNDQLVNLGDQIEYSYTVTNAGNKTLFNINIASSKGVFSAPAPVSELLSGATITDFSGTLTYAITQADLDSSCECVANQTTFNANLEMSTTSPLLSGLSDDPTINTNIDVDGDSYPDDITITALPFPRTGGSNSNELFISEFIEGSSFNKAIEIANFTGATVDLSVYSLKRQQNGAGAWVGNTPLVGSVLDGDVFVAANNQANTDILAVADQQVTGGNAIDYNGNDAVGLFKNDVLIDIVGTFNGGPANFAQDITLVRKPEVTGPNLTFDIDAEWTSFPRNTSTDLGRHTYNGATAGENDQLLSAIKIYPNPSKGTFYIGGLQEQVNVIVYDVVGKVVLKKELTGNQFSIEQPGIYFVKLQSNSLSRTIKVIVQ